MKFTQNLNFSNELLRFQTLFFNRNSLFCDKIRQCSNFVNLHLAFGFFV